MAGSPAMHYCWSHGIDCGIPAVTSPESDFICTQLPDNTLEITGYRGTQTQLTIPSTINGRSVSAIGESAFANFDEITQIYLPEGLVSIGSNAFADCSALKALYIPANTVSIETDALRRCSSLTEFVVSTQNTGFTTLDGALMTKDKSTLLCYPAGKKATTYAVPACVTALGGYAFSAAALSEITLPAGLRTIGRNAFSGTKITSLVVPEGMRELGDFACADAMFLKRIALSSSLTRIGEHAFDGCFALSTLTIPAATAEIGAGALNCCPALTQITVASGNTAFKSVSGVLFTKDGTRLIRYPSARTGTSYTVPSGVVQIDARAFGENKTLKSVSLPATLKRIGSDSFYFTPALTTMTLPEGMTSIGAYVFGMCGQLKSLYVPASVSAIGEDAFADCPLLTVQTPEDSPCWSYCVDNGINLQAVS